MTNIFKNSTFGMALLLLFLAWYLFLSIKCILIGTGKLMNPQTKEKANRPKLFDALGIAGDAEKAVCESLTDDDLTYNLYFENETEWKRDDGKMEELRKIAACSQTELQSEAKDFDIFKDISRLFNRRATRFVYFQPCAFLNHLDKVVTPPEFNPYAGKRIVIPSDYHEEYRLDGTRHFVGSKGMTFTASDNPGFAPETTEYTEYSHTGKFYTKVTGGFRENYTDVMCDSKNKLTYRERDGFTNENPKLHVGVDFRGNSNNRIISLVGGTVLGYGIFRNYGKVVFVGHSSGTGVYLAAHLSCFNDQLLETGIVSPGDWIGYVGGTGINGEIRYSEHLHVSCFDINWEKVPSVSRNPIANSHLYDDMVQKMVNPFNHDERY